MVVEGAHLCAMLRGVKKAEAMITTSTMRGLFKTDQELRREFYARLTRRRYDE